MFYCSPWAYRIFDEILHITSVGVSLELLGQVIPNNSLVNLDDLQYHPNNNQPTNGNGQQTLMCVTDLVDCCEPPRTVRGDWYYPDGGTIVFNTRGATFQRNRGANEVINGQHFFGSVRLWRRYTPLERGLFRCEIPDANGVNQNLYVNICEFPIIFNAPIIVNQMYTLHSVFFPSCWFAFSLSGHLSFWFHYYWGDLLSDMLGNCSFY